MIRATISEQVFWNLVPTKMVDTLYYPKPEATKALSDFNNDGLAEYQSADSARSAAILPYF